MTWSGRLDTGIWLIQVLLFEARCLESHVLITAVFDTLADSDAVIYSIYR